MSETFIMSIGKEAIMIAMLVAAPALLISMLVGLIISIFQAVTQIQEQTLTFVPKMVAIVVILLVFGPWMLKTLVGFVEQMLSNITYIVR
jgi:flagellar biosynthesis protein FliQ